MLLFDIASSLFFVVLVIYIIKTSGPGLDHGLDHGILKLVKIDPAAKQQSVGTLNYSMELEVPELVILGFGIGKKHLKLLVIKEKSVVGSAFICPVMLELSSEIGIKATLLLDQLHSQKDLVIIDNSKLSQMTVMETN